MNVYEIAIEIERLENKIKTKIRSLHPEYIDNNFPEICTNFPTEINDGSHTSTDDTSELFEEIFWKRVHDDIKHNNYTCIIPLLKDIAKGIRKLVPHNTKFLESFAEVIDIEYIQQKIDQKIMFLNDIIGYMNFIVEQVSQLQSVVEGNKTTDWWTKTWRELQTPFVKYEYYLPLFFRVIINKLDQTYNILHTPDIMQLKEAIKAQK